MFMKMQKRRYITLIEIMIVMFLIALIAGVLTYNTVGSLDKGRAFKTKTGIEKLETILSLKVAENPDALNDMESKWRDYVATSPLVQNPKALIKDGWGQDYKVTVEGSNIKITSEKYENYVKAHPEMGYE
jgi:general secretion pathway protein G